MSTSDPNTTYLIVGIVALIAIVIIAIAISRRNRSQALRRRFGPEYDRTVQQAGSTTDAEKELAKREARVKRMHIEELPAGAKTRYTEEWRTTQRRFVDEPKGALVEADTLLTNIMRDRGYPTDNFDQTVADLSPDHPSVLENYRTAHDITVRSERGDVTTEDLRQAMVHYRALFDDLVK